MSQPPVHRSDAFAPDHEPLREHASLQLARSRVTGPLKFLNPTQAHFRHVKPEAQLNTVDGSYDEPAGTHDGHQLTGNEALAARAEYRWSSRNNRKGRHQIVIKPFDNLPGTKFPLPKKTRHPGVVLRTVGRMLVEYPYWDISWLVAYIFTWGSIVWVINAFFVWLPLVRPSTEFKNEILTGGGITAFIGATIFEIGSIFLMLEAINENRQGCFGWAVKKIFDPHNGERVELSPDPTGCSHHHTNKHNLVGRSKAMSAAASGDEEAIVKSSTGEQRSWTWFPTSNELRSHYVHEIGFLACSAQMFGATIFWISGFTALPGILNHLSPHLEDGIYWTPQVVGGSGFIVSGVLFMLETQKRWYRPAINVLGWHIGFWNLIGGVGFTLCPTFGYDTQSWAQYQASLSTFWGSWAFLIGSSIQLYESLQKHPVDVEGSSASDRDGAWVAQDDDQG